MAKVYLSPSSQVSNPYAWGSTNEAAQCRRIADAAAAALTRSGPACLHPHERLQRPRDGNARFQLERCGPGPRRGAGRL